MAKRKATKKAKAKTEGRPYPEAGDRVVFWRDRGQDVLEACVALVLGESPRQCSVCGEEQDGHDRPNRKHAFALSHGGHDLSVEHAEDGKAYTYRHVKMGHLPNRWTLDEEGTMPVNRAKINLRLDDSKVRTK